MLLVPHSKHLLQCLIKTFQQFLIHFAVLHITGIFTGMETQTTYLSQHLILSVLLNFLSIAFNLCGGEAEVEG